MGEIEKEIAAGFVKLAPEQVESMLHYSASQERYLPGYLLVPDGLTEYIDSEKLVEAFRPLCEKHPKLEMVYWFNTYPNNASRSGVISWQERKAAYDYQPIIIEEIKHTENSDYLKEGHDGTIDMGAS